MGNINNNELLTTEKPIIKQEPEYKLKLKLRVSPAENRQEEGGLRTKGYYKKSEDNKPLISVVTVVYNGKENLEQTIKSVLNQTYRNVEFIVIDGGSTDGTLDIIKKYTDQIDYWVSEPDSGIYDAMNKGASLCTGDYVAFLNADDWYNADTIQSVVSALAETDAAYIFGNVDIYDKGVFEFTLKERLKEYKIKMPFGHPSLFVLKKYLLTNPFDTQYKVVADYNFVLGLIKQNLPHHYIDKSLVNFRAGGISSTSNYDKEKFHIYRSHFGLLRGTRNYFHLKSLPIFIKICTIIDKIFPCSKDKNHAQ